MAFAIALPVQGCLLITDPDRDRIGDRDGGGGGAAGSNQMAGMGGVMPSDGGADARAGVGGMPTMGGAGGEPIMGGTAGMAGTMGGMGGSAGTPNTCALTRCGEDCVDTSMASLHCGACDRPCLDDAATASVQCSGGRCNQACNAGFGNCRRPTPPTADDGCETNFNADATCGTNCGNIRACAANEDCVNGTCLVPCAFTRCGSSCVDTATTEAHCGACNHACLMDRSTTTLECIASQCEQACTSGFGNCSQPAAPAADDGCETNFNDSSTCGTSCQNMRACAMNETCIDGACVPQTNCTFTLCASDCVDLGVGIVRGLTTEHCGGCDRVCSLDNAASADCASALCAASCIQGFGDCRQPTAPAPDDGCETNLSTSVSDCGVCGRACSTANTMAAGCNMGLCVPTCSTSFGDCNRDDGNDTDDGCETNLASGTASGSTTTNCGACAYVCSLTNATSAGCVSGECVPECSAGFDDCNSSVADDGCETDLATASASCGACGRACVSSPGTLNAVCSTGLCAPVCRANYADCNPDTGTGTDDGCETHLNANASCGTACGSVVSCLANEVCNSGTCGAPVGLTVFSVPLTATGQIQRYADNYQNTPLNLLNATVTVRLYAPGATGGELNFYVTDADFSPGPGLIRPLSTLSAGWVELTLGMGGINGAFDPSGISQIRLEIMSGGVTTTWNNPTLIYVDSIVSSNTVLNDQFATSFGAMVRSGSAQITGSTLTWTASLP